MAKRRQKKQPPIRPASTSVAAPKKLVIRLNSEWLWGLALLLAVAIVYQPVWYAGYLWDDDTLLTANPCIVGRQGLIDIWTSSAANICPLVITSYWIEHAIWGLNPLPYHLVNVLLHGTSAVLLWRILLNLRVPGAWLGAALWALHPVQVESVAWITEMKNTQSGLFYLLSILFFLKWLRTRTGWPYALTLIFAAMAMASKPSTVILPLILCLCAWWVEGRWNWRNLLRTAPLFLLSLAASALSIWIQKTEHTFNPLTPQNWIERLLTATSAIWFYLAKLLWPYPLATIYPFGKIDPTQPLAYLPLLATLVLAIVLWIYRNTWARPIVFGFAYFVIALLPVLDLVDMNFFNYSYVADHFQYLADMAPLALAGAGLAKLSELLLPGKPWPPRIAAAALLLVLAALGWTRAWAYQSEETLWTDELSKNPACWIAYNNLGVIYGQQGQFDSAGALYQKALELNPNYADAHTNLGFVFFKQGQLDTSILQFREAIKINPYLAMAHNDLGTVLFLKHQPADALGEFQKALELTPQDAVSNYSVGYILLQTGRSEEAIPYLQTALEISPNLFPARENLGSALLNIGRVNEAIDQLQETLRINPNSPDAHNCLGAAFFQKGELAAATAQFQEALRLDPGNAEASANLAKINAPTRSTSAPK